MMKSKITKALALTAAVFGLQSFTNAAMADTDELGLTPKHWYKFNGNLNSSGATALTIGGENGDSYVDAMDGQAYKFRDDTDPKCHPYGSGIARGNGDFTVVAAAKTADLDHGIVWSQGTKTSARGFALVAVGADKVAVRKFGSNWSSAGEDIITATVSDATTAYHVYTLVYQNSGYKFTLYVDDNVEPAGSGTVGDSASQGFPNDNWQFGSLFAGLNYSMVMGIGICMDDYRLYQQALKTDQIATIYKTTFKYKQPFKVTNASGKWTEAAWTDSSDPAKSVDAADWGTMKPNVTITLNEDDYFVLKADRDLNLGTVKIVNTAGDFWLTNGESTITADAIDASGSTATVSLNFNPGAAAITSGADTTLTQVGTGAITVGSGKVLTVTGDGLKASQVTNGGTVRFLGGSVEGPIAVTYDGDLTGVKLAEGTHVEATQTNGNKKYGVTGEGAGTSFFRIVNGSAGVGTVDGTQFRSLTLIANVGGNGFWIERANSLDATVDLVAEKEVVIFGYDPTIGTLSGSGTLGKNVATAIQTLTITPHEDATYSGTTDHNFVIAAAEGTETISGAYTGALTVQAGGKVALTGDANPSGTTSAGDLTIDAGKLTHSLALTGGTLNVIGEAGQSKYVITSGTNFTNDGAEVKLNGVPVLEAGYVVKGKELVRVYAAAIEDNTTWSALWASGEMPTADDDVILNIATNGATLTLDGTVAAANLHIVGEYGKPLTIAQAEGASVSVSHFNFSLMNGVLTISFNTGSASVTAGYNTILEDVGTGALTVGTGKTLTVKGGSLSASQVTNDGTIRFVGGTAEDPIDVAFGGTKGTSIGNFTIARDSWVKATATADMNYKATGEGLSSHFIVDGTGFDEEAALSDLTFIADRSTGGTDGLWIQQGIGEKVALDVPAGRYVTLELISPTFIGLTGAGTIQLYSGAGASQRVKINCAQASEYSGTSSVPFVIGGTAVQTISGAYTGDLTVNEGATADILTTRGLDVDGDGTVNATLTDEELTEDSVTIFDRTSGNVRVGTVRNLAGEDITDGYVAKGGVIAKAITITITNPEHMTNTVAGAELLSGTTYKAAAGDTVTVTYYAMLGYFFDGGASKTTTESATAQQSIEITTTKELTPCAATVESAVIPARHAPGEYWNLMDAVDAFTEDEDKLTILKDGELTHGIVAPGPTSHIDFGGCTLTAAYDTSEGYEPVIGVNEMTMLFLEGHDGTIKGWEGAAAAALDGKALIMCNGNIQFRDGAVIAGGEGDKGMDGVRLGLSGGMSCGDADDPSVGPTITGWHSAISTDEANTLGVGLNIQGGDYTAAATAENARNAAIYAPAAGHYYLYGGTFEGPYSISTPYANIDLKVYLYADHEPNFNAPLYAAEGVSPVGSTATRVINKDAAVELAIPPAYRWDAKGYLVKKLGLLLFVK